MCRHAVVNVSTEGTVLERFEKDQSDRSPRHSAAGRQAALLYRTTRTIVRLAPLSWRRLPMLVLDPSVSAGRTTNSPSLVAACAKGQAPHQQSIQAGKRSHISVTFILDPRNFILCVLHLSRMQDNIRDKRQRRNTQNDQIFHSTAGSSQRSTLFNEIIESIEQQQSIVVLRH